MSHSLLSQENVGGTTYFYPTTANHTTNQTNNSITSEALHSTPSNINYTPHTVHVYPGPASNVVNMQPRTQLSSAIFIPEEMRNGILERNEIANMIDPNPNPDIPSEIDSHHSLYALEPQPIHQKLPLPSSTYKATHNTTGVKYCLRRLHGLY